MKNREKEWDENEVPLLCEDAPNGLSKRVSWSSRVRPPQKVNSLVDFKTTVTKPHLSRTYASKSCFPNIPKPANWNRHHNEELSVKTYPGRNIDRVNLLMYRYGKPPKPPDRPRSPIIAPSKMTFGGGLSDLSGQLKDYQHVEISECQNNIEPTNQSKDWVMYINPSNGWPYYYNQKQNYSTYEKPPVEGKIFHGIMGGGSNVGEWVEYWDEEIEAFYYYNSISGEASWVNPDLL